MKILLIEVGYRIFFKKNILAAPQICELYHIKLENNKKTYFCHFPSADSQKTKIVDF